MLVAMFDKLMCDIIRSGRLTVIYPDGIEKSYGAIPHDNPSLDVAMRLHKPGTGMKLMANPYLHFGEAIMSGEVTVEQGSMWDLMDLLGRNLENLPPPTPWLKVWNRVTQAVTSHYDIAASKRNVAHHYDLSDALYRTFLDDDLQYSCAYFRHPAMTLEEAQLAKKRHLIAKLDLEASQTVLDIGCGWGGLALEIAKTEDVQVIGITLSKEQLEVARERARAAGLDGRVRFELIDYRELEGSFDRIISVGMFEHVGRTNFETYFTQIKSLLSDEGVAIVHSIGRHRPNSASNAWMRKYIFPGGYIPCLAEATDATDKADLWVTDVEILRLHYAETLKAWRERFLDNRGEMVALYDERFCRMWEFYLVCCEMSFRHGDLMVFQMQLTKRVDTLPVTRDYMVDRERKLSGAASEREAKIYA